MEEQYIIEVSGWNLFLTYLIIIRIHKVQI